MVASFLNRAIREQNIEIRTGSPPVTELLQENGRVIGGARTAAGGDEFRGPVVLCTSTYDWDPDLVREVLGLEPEDWGSVAPESVAGDGIKLAQQVGGQLFKIPPRPRRPSCRAGGPRWVPVTATAPPSTPCRTA